MNSNGFEQLINSPTRGRHCLDHIYVRVTDKISPSAVFISSGRSVHDIVICNLVMFFFNKLATGFLDSRNKKN